MVRMGKLYKMTIVLDEKGLHEEILSENIIKETNKIIFLPKWKNSIKRRQINKVVIDEICFDVTRPPNSYDKIEYCAFYTNELLEQEHRKAILARINDRFMDVWYTVSELRNHLGGINDEH
jgi:hypothetical protein